MKGLSKRKKQVLGAVVSCIVLACAGYAYWCTTLENDVIWPDYVINGVSIQGMTKQEALEAVEKKFVEDYGNSAYKISLANEEYEINIFSFLGLDVTEIVEKAYIMGHNDWYRRGVEKYQLDKNPEVYERNVIPEVVTTEDLSKLLKETNMEKVDTHVETTYEFSEEALLIHKGQAGVKADMEKLEEELLALLEEKNFSEELECPTIKTEPKDLDIAPLEKEIHVDPVSSYMDKKNDYKPTESVVGVSFDIEEAQQSFEDAEEGSDVAIEIEYTEPEMTQEELQSMLFRDVLGTYSTVGSGSSARINNLQLAIKSCNDVILNPGEIFSYNETLGERTAERGYQAAGVIANGQVVSGLGGGICQVSTTLYCACLAAELEIVDRTPHSMPVSYVPRGMDATVSWGSIDYKFKNSTEYPIKISSRYENGNVVFEIFGTKQETV